MKVVIIGTGNVATVLGKKIKDSSHSMLQVIGRTEIKAKQLAEILECNYSCNLMEINTSAELVIISTSDNSIQDIVNQLPALNAIIVHTAASIDMKVLSTASKKYGVLYPLQSLKKDTNTDILIPLLVDGNTQNVRKSIEVFATQISDKVLITTGEERLKLHVAAVFCNNFTNHLFTLAEAYCSSEGLVFNLLQPLIEETFKGVLRKSPQDLQTGPAKRGDSETINKHMNLLEEYSNQKEVYEIMTQSIIKNNSIRG